MLRKPRPAAAVIATLFNTLYRPDFSARALDEAETAQRYFGCHRQPGQSLARRVLLECMISSGVLGTPPRYKSKDWRRMERCIRHRIQRAGQGVRNTERPARKPDEAKREQWAALVEYIGGALKREELLGPRHDVDARFAETGSRLNQLLALLRVPGVRAQAESIWNKERADPETGEVLEPGPFPSVEALLRKIAESHGPADRLAGYERYTREYLGWKAAWAGQAIGLDATGLDIEVQGAWGDTNGGKPKRWAFVMVDAASGKQWIFAPHVRSEQAGWPAAADWLFKKLDWAPEYVFADRIGALFEGLGGLVPGEELLKRRKPAVPLGILALLACGVQVKVSRPETPTGKAFVERGIGVAKDHLVGLLVERAATLEHAGRLPQQDGRRAGRQVRRRHFDSEPDFQRCLSALVEHVNGLPDFRESGKSRDHWFFQHTASLERRRGDRALVADPWPKFLELAQRIRVCILQGSEVIATHDGGEAFARLNAPFVSTIKDSADGQRRIEARPAVVLAIPSGMLANDQDGLWRCYIIEKRQGLPAIQYAEATAYAKGDFGYSTGLNPLGVYRLRPETAEEEQRHAAQTAAAKYAETLPAQVMSLADAARRAAKAPLALPVAPAAAREETLVERFRKQAAG